MAKKRVKRHFKAPPLFEPIEAQAGQPDYAETLVRQLWPETPGSTAKPTEDFLRLLPMTGSKVHKGLRPSEEYYSVKPPTAMDTPVSESRSIMAEFSTLLKALRPKPLIISGWPEDEAELRAVQKALQAEMAATYPLGLPKLEESSGPVFFTDFLGSFPEGGLKDE